MPAGDEHLTNVDLRLPDLNARPSTRRRVVGWLAAATTTALTVALLARHEPAAADRSTTRTTASWRTGDERSSTFARQIDCSRAAAAQGAVYRALDALGEINALTNPRLTADYLDPRR